MYAPGAKQGEGKNTPPTSPPLILPSVFVSRLAWNAQFASLGQ